MTIVDAADRGASGCSHGNAGLIVPSHFVPLASPGAIGSGLRWLFDAESPFYIQPRANLELVGWLWRFFRASTNAHVERTGPVLRDLNLASRACYEALAAENEDFGLAREGVLMVCATEDALHEEAEVAERARALGLRATILDSAEVTRREPALSREIAGAVHYPQDCRLDPERLIGGLRRRLEALDVHSWWRRPVTGWQVTDDRVTAIETPRRPFACRRIRHRGGRVVKRHRPQVAFVASAAARPWLQPHAVRSAGTPSVRGPVHRSSPRHHADGRPASFRGHHGAGRSPDPGQCLARTRHYQGHSNLLPGLQR